MHATLGKPIGIAGAIILIALLGGYALFSARLSHLAVASPDPATAALGARLFSDRRLSADGKVSCATCHVPDKDYTDGRRVAVGVFGAMGTRNTPSLASVGVAKETAFFWDGRRTALEEATLEPLTNAKEMGLHDDAHIVQVIESDPGYRAAFADAFPNDHAISTEHVGIALASFIRSIKPSPSAYDRYASGQDSHALNGLALQGLKIFRGTGRCVDCHSLEGQPAVLTDNQYHRAGIGFDDIEADLPSLTTAIIKRSLKADDVGNRIVAHGDEAQLGRFNVTLDPADIGLFRTPSLRGVAVSAPYMHDGSVATLDDAVDREVYYRSLQSGRPLHLSVEDRAALKAFLQAL